MSDPRTLSAEVPAVAASSLFTRRCARVIDLRSPAEFAADHVPGAVNLPLFDDAERALIGTLYARASPAAAFSEAQTLARRRIDELLLRIADACDWELPAADGKARLDAMCSGGIDTLENGLVAVPSERLPARAVVFTCWRGGLRSRSVTALVRALGLERAVALEGGYKSYRRMVREGLDAWRAPHAFVLRGLTGVGKTLVLRELARLRPLWVVDLEALAGHRSSILGMVGLEPRTQKAFESQLFAHLRELPRKGPVVFEGESRKVGDVILPPRVWAALHGGTNIELVAPLERRVEVLLEDYLARPSDRGELRRQLPFIEERLGAVRWTGCLVGLLDAGREAELVRILLERYYDPLYRHSEDGRHCAATIVATDPARAAGAIAQWIEEWQG